jgi:hypothetical protein
LTLELGTRCKAVPRGLLLSLLCLLNLCGCLCVFLALFIVQSGAYLS